MDKEIKFVQLDFSNLILQKLREDRGGQLLTTDTKEASYKDPTDQKDNASHQKSKTIWRNFICKMIK